MSMLLLEGGGHSKKIVSKLNSGKLFAFDHDEDANKNKIESNKFKLINSNFRNIKRFLKVEGIEKIDGLLADLGVSSHQIDTPERGFSFRFDSFLDMRMNKNKSKSAIDIINDYSEEDLAKIFYSYGELRNSRRLASVIVKHRKNKKIKKVKELIKLIEDFTLEKSRNKFLSRIFQAIRIEVNSELDSLKEMLLNAVDMLNKNGRLVIISYHSLEDRIVKNLIKKGNFSGEVRKDFFGNIERDLFEINKKVIIPSDKEMKNNPRSRSAKLRIAYKINE